jgi:hypothetical protein
LLDRSRLKRAELTSGIGALVLGVGIGALGAGYLRSWAVPLLLLGVVVHGWGMFDKHRLEARNSAPALWWETAVYWFCWLLLVGAVIGVLGLVISARLFA